MSRTGFHIAGALCITLLTCSVSNGQDMVFNHPYAGMLYTNPAYTGVFGPLHAAATFRSQYSTSASPYTTYYIEADTFIEDWKSGFGGFLLNDRARGGQLVETAIGLSYMFNLRVSDELEFRPALQGVYHNKRRELRHFTFPDQIDIVGNIITDSDIGYEPYSFHTVDFSAGLLTRYRYLELGFSAHHLGAQGFENTPATPLKFSIQAKYIFSLNNRQSSLPVEISPDQWANLENISLVPYFQYTHQSVYQYINGGIILQSGALFAGGGVKTALQQKVVNMALSAGFITSGFRLGYSMDFIALGSSIKGWQGMSHEIFVHFSFGEAGESSTGRGKGRKWRSRSTCGCYL